MFRYSTVIHKQPLFKQLNEFLIMEQNYKKLKEFQSEKLKKVILSAKESVPVHSSININKSIKEIPIFSKQFLLEHYEDCISDQLEPNDVYLSSTSGTSGPVLDVIKDNSSNLQESVNMLKILYQHGIHSEVNTVRELKVLELDPNSIDFHEYPVGKTDLYRLAVANLFTRSSHREVCNFIQDFAPEVISGSPSQIILLKELLTLYGVELPHTKYLITTGENVSEGCRLFLEESFNSKLINVYKLKEIGLIGYQCPQNPEHLHINEDSVLLQVEECGVTRYQGEVIVTDLNNITMPIIRYQTRDYATLSHEKCSCERATKYLKNIYSHAQIIRNAAEGDFTSIMSLHETLNKLPITYFQILYMGTKNITVRIVLNHHSDKEKIFLNILNHPSLTLFKTKVEFANISSLLMSNYKAPTFINMKEIENKYELISCPICGEKGELVETLGSIDEPLNIAKCSCGLVYLNPRPLKEYYNEHYTAFSETEDFEYDFEIITQQLKEHSYITEKTLYERVHRFKQGPFKHILDIGCGMGTTLNYFKKQDSNIEPETNSSGKKSKRTRRKKVKEEFQLDDDMQFTDFAVSSIGEGLGYEE